MRVTISSTYIRACVAAGDMVSAARALGRPHRVDGVVVRGDRRGKAMGYPTANVESPAVHRDPGRRRLRRAPGDCATPAAAPAASACPAAISVGSNPTFQGSRRTVEAFVLDYDGDLYGEHVGVEFVQRLRRCCVPDVDGLLAAMAKDVSTPAILDCDARLSRRVGRRRPQARRAARAPGTASGSVAGGR